MTKKELFEMLKEVPNETQIKIKDAFNCMPIMYVDVKNEKFLTNGDVKSIYEVILR